MFISFIFSDWLCNDFSPFLSAPSNCQKWDRSKQTPGRWNALEFILKGVPKSGGGLLVCCALFRSSISGLLGYGVLWIQPPLLLRFLSYILPHSPLLVVGKETCRIFCHLSQRSCSSHCCVLTGHQTICYKPFYFLTRDPVQWDFSLWVFLIHHLIDDIQPKQFRDAEN